KESRTMPQVDPELFDRGQFQAELALKASPIAAFKKAIRQAREGEPPQSGVVLLAGTNHHIRLLKNGTLAYTAEPVNEIYRPSIDVFFESVASHWNGDAVGVLLTGMGRDGAQGLKLMREQGYLTIAQDQQSSAVYGMPKAAAAIDAAVEIRPLDRIAPRLLEVFSK
ncbi:chemotaxis protein CheB, partial [Pseudomonas emilianonis]|uniref:chemotaxis protein CheB n=1 Tax=Pseudomonas emilianonis TaxID=2915812 RepID=UPI0024A63958